jgi:outer membrane translocation and assembly module TamA
VISLRIGGVVFSDVGRVWLAGEESNTWHASYGGGVLMQPVGLPITLNTTVGTGTEGLRWYFGFGYPF